MFLDGMQNNDRSKARRKRAEIPFTPDLTIFCVFEELKNMASNIF
jgi:hypothetical protein